MRMTLVGLLALAALTAAGCDRGYASVGDPQDYFQRTGDPYAQQLNAHAVCTYAQTSYVRLWIAWDELAHKTHRPVTASRHRLTVRGRSTS
jgi:hypothetical protein